MDPTPPSPAPAPAPAPSPSPARTSSRPGGQYGAAALAERSAERESSMATRATELAAAQRALRELHTKIGKLEAAELACGTAAATAAEREATAAATAARVEAALEEKIASTVKAAAAHNMSFAVSEPLVAASIRAATMHARDVAVARRDGTWRASGNFKCVSFAKPPPGQSPPCCFDEMAAGCVHKVVDWREFDPNVLFVCPKCSSQMEVATHLPEPDGVRRDQISCTASGKLGLTREEGAAQPTTISSVQLRCTSGACSHYDCMHAPAIIKQLPGLLRVEYPCEVAFCVGVQLHFSKDLTRLAEPLYEESPTSVAGLQAACDERLARQYEDGMLRWMVRRREYISSLPEEERAAAAAQLRCIDETMRKQLYGVAASESALGKQLEAKLVADAPVRTAELQSLEPPEGGLHHLGFDDNDVIAKACQVAGGFDSRKLVLARSAHTKLIYGAALLPDASWACKHCFFAELAAQLAPVKMICVDNLPTNYAEMKALFGESAFLNDLKHMLSRVNGTSRAYSREHGAQIKLIARMITAPREEGEHSVAAILKKLRTPGGMRDGGQVLVERGRGKTKPTYFVFGQDGNVMPEHLIQKIINNGCFEVTFAHNIMRDWRPVEEIKRRLVTFRSTLATATTEYHDVVRHVRADMQSSPETAVAADGSDASSTLGSVASMSDAMTEASEACLAAFREEAVDVDGAALELAATAAAAAACRSLGLLQQQKPSAPALASTACTAACTAASTAASTASSTATCTAIGVRPSATTTVAAATVVAAPPSHKAALALLKEEQLQVKHAVMARPALATKLATIGAYFNDGNVLEHTWTTSTLPALDLCISKVQWLDRPPESVMPRHHFEGVDARGLDYFSFIDGTNWTEASFGEIEKGIFENGGYNEAKWNGLLLNKIGRINERVRGLHAGHYDLDQQRMANALAASYGDPLPHPHLAPLKPPALRSTALQGIGYFHAELGRRAERARLAAEAAAAAAAAARARGAAGAPALPPPAAVAVPPPPPQLLVAAAPAAGLAPMEVEVTDAQRARSAAGREAALARRAATATAAAAGGPGGGAAGGAAGGGAASGAASGDAVGSTSVGGGAASLAMAGVLGDAETAAAAFVAPPLKRHKGEELPGIVPGMRHYGKSKQTLVGCDLSHGTWRCCECPAKGKSAKHAAGCEHGIILAAKKVAGYNNKGHKKK